MWIIRESCGVCEVVVLRRILCGVEEAKIERGENRSVSTKERSPRNDYLRVD